MYGTSPIVRLLASPNPNALERVYAVSSLALGRLPAWTRGNTLDPAADMPVFAQHAPRSQYLEPKLAHLARNGYDTVTSAGYEAWCRGEWQPARPTVMLTFDDGLREFARSTAPLLKAYGCAAVLFVCPGLVDLASHPDDPLGALVRREYLDWDELRALARDGTVDIQSHGMWHNRVPVSAEPSAAIRSPLTSIRHALDILPATPMLDALVRGDVPSLARYPSVPLYLSRQADAIRDDAQTSREAIERQIGTPARAFAFPWWNGSRAAKRAVRDAGFSTLFTGLAGRLRGRPTDGQAAGRLGFDWIACLPGWGRTGAAELLVQKATGQHRD